MATQLGLPIHERVRKSLEAAAKEIRGSCRIIAKKGKQEALARAAGMDPGNFSRALAGDTYKLDLDMLPVFFAEDQDERVLIRLLCRLCGGKFTPDPEITPEQRVENLLRACRRSGAAGEAILRDAGENDT